MSVLVLPREQGGEGSNPFALTIKNKQLGHFLKGGLFAFLTKGVSGARWSKLSPLFLSWCVHRGVGFMPRKRCGR